MLFELHDIIPYFFSISIIASFAYAAYFFHRQSESDGYWLSDVQPERHPEARLPGGGMRAPQGHKLIRTVKRKESPDGDSADCFSLSTDGNPFIRQGGPRWTRNDRLLETRRRALRCSACCS